MKKTLLIISALIAAITASAASKSAQLTINDRVKYQHVTGFGGFSPSPTWQYWLTDTQMDVIFGQKPHQIGCNIVRLYIANNKGAWGASVANAKRAKANGAIVFASPWSPPAAWKSNGTTGNGGYLLESHYKDWALFLNDYYLYMKQQGVEIDAISLQNEPDWSPEYESCIWTGEQMAKFLREYGSLIQCKIIAPEAIHFSRNLHEPILNDPEACAQLDIVGGHFYGWDGSSYPLAAQMGKEVWMTEYLINERQQNNNINIDWKTDGFLFARSINDAMLANMSAWVHYSIKRYYGLIGDGSYGTTNNVITKRAFIMSHYAKYVKNTTRIAHSLSDETGKLTGSAYLTPSGDSIVVMVLNPSANTYQTSVELPFNTCGTFIMTTTETTSRVTETKTMSSEGYTTTETIEPYSVKTFIYEKTSERKDLPDDDPTAETIFQDNFAYSGASCVPTGWRAKADNELRKAGNYSLGPRIMGFSPEGLLSYGFYFRTGTAAVGYVSYGEETDSRLYLEPGKYTLSYSTVGWKANPTITGAVQKANGTIVKTLPSKPTSYISDSGSSVRVTETTDFSIDFEVTEADNYLLKWTIAKASSGMNEALLGNVKLIRHKEILKGDVNGDSKVTKNDANLIVSYYLGNPVNINIQAADMDGDGKVTISDANAILLLAK